jgi:hypothetical protein
MAIQHRDIPDAQLHEPKGASTALIKTVWVADGTGSGSFQKLDTTAIGVVDGGLANKQLVSDGSGGIKLVAGGVYGVMSYTGVGGRSVLPANGNLNDPAPYVVLTGTTSPWAAEQLQGVTFDTNKLIVSAPGLYRVTILMEAYCNISGSNAFAIRPRINTTGYVQRKSISNIATTTESVAMLPFTGYLTLAANDSVCVTAASSGVSNSSNGVGFYAGMLSLELIKGV